MLDQEKIKNLLDDLVQEISWELSMDSYGRAEFQKRLRRRIYSEDLRVDEGGE